MLSQGRRVSVRAAQRAKMILLAGEGHTQAQIAAQVGCIRQTVALWCERFVRRGVQGIVSDARRGGRPADRGMVTRIIEMTTQTRPENATHWSTRTLAAKLGTSDTMVQRVWKANGLKPHRIEAFKISTDPLFEQKLNDVVGLYMNPPAHALVLCVDEKTQVQALDRTQPGLPLKKGRAQTLTHDYKRHGTTTLFAALNTLDGAVISACKQRHRHVEWLEFLRQIERETPADKVLHLICDNYAAHKHAKVIAWLEKHPRFHVHYTPTSASWLNMVERFFRSLSQDQLKRGVFRSLPELNSTIEQYVLKHNLNPKPFVWTAKAQDILQKVIRAKTAQMSATA